MIFQCDDLERALGSPELMPDAQAHAEHCERCRRELYLWNEISRLAPGLHKEWESPALWPQIQTQLAASQPRRKGPPVWSWALAAAAALILATVLMFPWKRNRPPSQAFLTETALKEVQQAEDAYAKSIDRLAAVAGPSLNQVSPIADAYREKLTLLDSAIAELKANIATNRYNTYLQNQLASLYRQKQTTLQGWMENVKNNR